MMPTIRYLNGLGSQVPFKHHHSRVNIIKLEILIGALKELVNDAKKENYIVIIVLKIV